MYFEYFRPLLWSTPAVAPLKTHKSSFCNQLQADSRENTATWSCKPIPANLLGATATCTHTGTQKPSSFLNTKSHSSYAHRFVSSLSAFSDSKAELWDGKKTAELHPLVHISWSLQVCLFAFIATCLKEILKRPQRTKDLMI